MEIVIAHITDIHFKQESDLNTLRKRINSIVGAILETIRKANETMLLICVTGDIAYSGTEEQYIMAETFFDEIYNKITERREGLSAYFVFVPGNHDCDFDDISNTVRTTIINSKELNINDASTISICTSVQKNYYSFVNKYIEKEIASANKQDSIFTEDKLTNRKLGKYNIILHCLNTAWCSSKNEIKNMKFSVPDGIEEKSDNDIVITLMHHGDEWFDWKGKECWEEYHKKNSDIILVGHDHCSQFVHKYNYDSTSNYFIKGNQLYSTEDPEQSGFNIFKVNLDDNTEIFYTYAWNGHLYERIIDSKAQKFERKKFYKSKVKLDKELVEFLERIEIDIYNKYKSPLRLSDIYVYPTLKGEGTEKLKKMTTVRGQDSIIEVIQSTKKVIISGYKEYGKTALLKRLFSIFYEMNFFPVFIDVGSIDSASEDRVNELIRKSYKTAYNNLNIDEVMQMEMEKRICFIDDFDEIGLNDKTKKDFLDYINNQFSIVILTIDYRNNIISTVKNLETNEYIEKNFHVFKIQPLKQFGRNRIIDKWILLEDPEQDVNSLDFDVKRKTKLSQMQRVLKNGYFSNTPLEFLLVLSYIDNSQSMNADYSRYSYVYDCLIRDKINKISEEDTNVALAYKTLLENLAYDLYINNADTLFEEQYLLNAIANYNENYPPFKGTSTKIIQKLVQYKIIEERNDKFKFKYNYMYYYFVGSYIVDILSPDDKKTKIMEILSNLSVQKNYDIALFIAYSMNAEHDILPKLESLCSQLLTQYEDFKYEDQKKLLDKINANVIVKLNKLYAYNIPMNQEIPELQKRKQIQQDDDDDEAIREVEVCNDITEEKFENVFGDFSKLLRLIEFQGDILKNYATKIKNKPRKDIIALMGNSNLKLIGFFCVYILDNIDKIINLVEREVRENHEKAPQKEILINFIKEYLSILWAEFIELNVNSLSSCWECEAIQVDIDEYKDKMQSAFFDMVNIEYKIRITDSKLPVADIKNCLSGKKKMDSFSMGIMKNVIASYLVSYQYDNIDKEKVCQWLGFNYKSIFLQDKKNETLELI